jgi:flagellar biosynthetic protein FliP
MTRPQPNAIKLVQFKNWAAVLLALLLFLSPQAVVAQDALFGLSDDPALTERAVQIFLIVTVLSIVPGLAIMATCFPFMVTVLAILRQGLGLQTSPPNMLIVSLALFLTYFVMEPTFLTAWSNGIRPIIDGAIDVDVGIRNTIDPFRQFMFERVSPKTLTSFADLRNEPAISNAAEVPLSILVPSFLVSEIELAFQIGFLVFLPFLIIDLVVAAILMSMGMMMVPPAIVSLPFKLAFFVVADGWSLVSGALVRSYF